MISKERLEELIKDGATIYEAKYGKVNPVDFTKQKVRCICKKLNMIDFEPSREEKYLNHKYFHRLYETKEQAEWASKYQRIPHTEYLDLPMWEEIGYGYSYILEFGNSCLEVNKTNNKIFVMTNKNYLGLYDYIFSEPATEENYIKACNVVLKLFKGE